MINWFNMPTEGLSNGGQSEIKELTATENKTYEKDGEVYNKVTVNVSGGGSSDFSTAEVTLINRTEHDTDLALPFDDEHEGQIYTNALFTIAAGETVTINVVKGTLGAVASIITDQVEFGTVSGNIAAPSVTLLTISGNGTAEIVEPAG